MSGENVRFEREGAVATIMIAREAVRNAIDQPTLAALDEAVVRVDGDADLRVAILTGEGKRAFSAGGDIAAMVTMSADDGLAYRVRAHRMLERMERSGKIFIAAMNGHALGGGLEVALACDILLASSAAKLGLPELSVGLIPGWGGMQRLSRAVGLPVAKEMVLAGRILEAEEARQLGLVSRVVEPESTLEEARAIARRIVSFSPTALRQAKKSLTEGAQMPLRFALAYDVESATVNFASEHRVEGLRAFLEKRAPVY